MVERKRTEKMAEEIAEDKKARFENTKSGGAKYALSKKYLNDKKHGL